METTERERNALRRLWDRLESTRGEVDAVVEEAARKIPSFATLLETMSPELRAQQQARSMEVQREALVEGRWEPYDDDLRTQGKVYAQMGIAFSDWYALLGSFRELIYRDLLPPGDTRLDDVLLGTNVMLDHAMSLLGEAYVDAKQALVRTLEAQLQLHIDLVQNAPVGMMIVRWETPPDAATFRVVASNPAASRMGAAIAIVTGDATRRHGSTSLDLLDRFVSCLRTREPQSWTATSGARGSERTFAVRCFSLGDEHVGVIVEDVTERHRMQHELARHVQDLERSNRELDEFAYVASHDLKAPLQDVRNLSGWIAEDLGAALAPATARHLALLGDRVGRMERLLDDLLDYSRAGRRQEGTESVAVADVAADVAAFFGPPPGFTIAVSGEAPPVATARAPLEKVIRNLVGNAIKHHDRGGGRIEIAVAASDDGVRVRVTDDGPGIPQEFHERVFRMFQTLRPRDEVEGSGMGLTIVRKTVEARGGEVKLESQGRGTSVSFTWPLGAAVGGAA
jgi:signal transduction histidine kinase